MFSIRSEFRYNQCTDEATAVVINDMHSSRLCISVKLAIDDKYINHLFNVRINTMNGDYRFQYQKNDGSIAWLKEFGCIHGYRVGYEKLEDNLYELRVYAYGDLFKNKTFSSFKADVVLQYFLKELFELNVEKESPDVILDATRLQCVAKEFYRFTPVFASEAVMIILAMVDKIKAHELIIEGFPDMVKEFIDFEYNETESSHTTLRARFNHKQTVLDQALNDLRTATNALSILAS